MTALRPLLSLSFSLIAALPSEAQQLAPAALRASDRVMIERNVGPLVAAGSGRDTLPPPPRETHPVGTIIGGTLGAAAGTVVGVLAGAAISSGCHGEECQLGPALLGGLVGESLGLALGAHVGSRSPVHSHIVTTALTSVGVAVGSILVGAGIGRFGAVMVPLTPAFQLAAAMAIESR